MDNEKNFRFIRRGQIPSSIGSLTNQIKVEGGQ